MSTMKPAIRWPEPPKASHEPSEKPERELPANASRTPKPRVLARFPDLDAPEPVAEPVDAAVAWEGRIINQKLARRILVGVAVVLVLAAVVPVVFHRKGSPNDAENAAKAKPSWQPENPAPDASMAPAWNDAATQLGEAVEPRKEMVSQPVPPRETEVPDGTRDLPASSGDDFAAETPGPANPVTDSAAQTTWNSEQRAATANRSHSIVPPGDAGMGDGANSRFEQAAWSEPGRQRAPAGATANRETAVSEPYPASRDSRDYYPPAQPEPEYRRGYGSGGSAESYGGYDTARWNPADSAPATYEQERAPAYQPYQNEAPASAWQEPSYRHADPNAAPPRGYAGSPAPDMAGRSAYDSPAGFDGRRTHHAADYRSAPEADYRSAPVADYRTAPEADYRADPYLSGYQNAPQDPRASRYQHENAYGRDEGAYRPAPGYYQGSGTRAAPGGAAPHYQADRRYEASAGYAPPVEARFRGTIEQPPAPAHYDNSGSRLY